jgi:hypothetical protein
VAVLAFALPILPGKQEAWRRFCQELLESRYREYEESRQNLSISREVIWFTQTAQGEMAIVFLEAEHPEQLVAGLEESNLPFDSWLRQQLLELHGLDAGRLFHGLTQELIFTWQASS